MARPAENRYEKKKCESKHDNEDRQTLMKTHHDNLVMKEHKQSSVRKRLCPGPQEDGITVEKV
jgi:hypothetical protein